MHSLGACHAVDCKIKSNKAVLKTFVKPVLDNQHELLGKEQ